MKITNENVSIKQTLLDGIKWFVCLLKLIGDICPLWKYELLGKKIHLVYCIIIHGFQFYIYILFIMILAWHL